MGFCTICLKNAETIDDFKKICIQTDIFSIFAHQSYEMSCAQICLFAYLITLISGKNSYDNIYLLNFNCMHIPADIYGI